jgi:hypothetical protein
MSYLGLSQKHTGHEGIYTICQNGPPIRSEPELSTLFRRLRALGHCRLHWTFFGKHYFDWEAQVLSIPLFWDPWWMLLCLIGNILLHHFSSLKSKSARIQQYSVTSDVPYGVKIWFKKVCSYNPSSGKCIILTPPAFHVLNGEMGPEALVLLGFFE